MHWFVKLSPVVYSSQIENEGKSIGCYLILFEVIINTGRTKRSILPTSKSWPPRSVENWIEVLVVVDGPMVKYHGKRIRHYVLTLMQIVSDLSAAFNIYPKILSLG